MSVDNAMAVLLLATASFAWCCGLFFLAIAYDIFRRRP